MTARHVVYNERDPDIGIVLVQKSNGWAGECTECGRPMFRWSRERAIERAQAHVDSHDI